MEELEAILETGTVAAVEVAASALAERGVTPGACSNCGKPLIGAYCAVCGQPLNTHRRSVHHLFRDFIKDIASFDSRILRTATALVVRPGELASAFREGRTQRYVPPVRLYLFVSLLFFLFLSATGIGLIQFNLQAERYRVVSDAAGHVYKEINGKRELMEGMKAGEGGKVVLDDPDAKNTVTLGMVADGKPKTSVTNNLSFFQRPLSGERMPAADLDAMLKDTKINLEINGKKADAVESNITSTLEKLRRDPGALNGPLSTWIPRILFVLVPLFALLLALFYRHQRKDYLFVDHLVFSLTMHSFSFVALIVAASLAQVMAGSWVADLFLLALSLYFFLSLKFFYRQGWFKTAVKFASISLVYFLFFLMPALVFALVASVVWA